MSPKKTKRPGSGVSRGTGAKRRGRSGAASKPIKYDDDEYSEDDTHTIDNPNAGEGEKVDASATMQSVPKNPVPESALEQVSDQSQSSPPNTGDSKRLTKSATKDKAKSGTEMKDLVHVTRLCNQAYANIETQTKRMKLLAFFIQNCSNNVLDGMEEEQRIHVKNMRDQAVVDLAQKHQHIQNLFNTKERYEQDKKKLVYGDEQGGQGMIAGADTPGATSGQYGLPDSPDEPFEQQPLLPENQSFDWQGIPLKQENLDCLNEGQWLDDQIIHLHLRNLWDKQSEESKNRWRHLSPAAALSIIHSENETLSTELREIPLLFVPINNKDPSKANDEGTHWSLLILDNILSKGYHYDSSLNSSSGYQMNNVTARLALSRALKMELNDQLPFEIINGPTQENGKY